MISSKKTLFLFTYLAVQCLRMTTSMEEVSDLTKASSLTHQTPLGAEADTKVIGASGKRAGAADPESMDIDQPMPHSIQMGKIDDEQIVKLTLKYFPALGDRQVSDEAALRTKSGFMVDIARDKNALISAESAAAVQKLQAVYRITDDDLKFYKTQQRAFWEKHTKAKYRHLHTDLQPDDVRALKQLGNKLLHYEAIVVAGGLPGQPVAKLEALLLEMFPFRAARPLDQRKPRLFSGTCDPHSTKYKHTNENKGIKHLTDPLLPDILRSITPEGEEAPPMRTKTVGEKTVPASEPWYAKNYKDYLSKQLETEGATVAFDMLSGLNDIAHLFEDERYTEKISVLTTAMLNFETRAAAGKLGWNYSYNGSRDPLGLQSLIMSKIAQLHFSQGASHPQNVHRYLVDSRVVRAAYAADPNSAKAFFGAEKGFEGLYDYLKLADETASPKLDQHTINKIAIQRETLSTWTADKADREINPDSNSFALASTPRGQGISTLKWATKLAAEMGMPFGPAQDTGVLSLLLDDLRAAHSHESYAFSFAPAARQIGTESPAPSELKIKSEGVILPVLEVKPATSASPTFANIVVQSEEGIQASDKLIENDIRQLLAHYKAPASRFRR